MAWADDRIADIEREIASHRDSVDHLKSGKLTLYEGDQRKVGLEAIQVHEGAIQQLERLLAVYKAARDKS